jgi:hypothetical protein
MGVGGQRRFPLLYHRERRGTHCIGGLVGPVWTGAVNLAPTGIWFPDRSARNASLYLIRYHATSVLRWIQNLGKYFCKTKDGKWDKGHPATSREVPEVEWMDCSTPSLTSVLLEVGGQRHAPAALPRGKRSGTLCNRTLGWPQGLSGQG